MRKRLPFPVFETAGTEDFNYLEMRDMDRALETSHHLAIFEGPHTWLPSEVATEAVEWMEIQAVKSGRKLRDQAEVDAIYATRLARAGAVSVETYAAMSAIVSDFTGLRRRCAIIGKGRGEVGPDKHFQTAMKEAAKNDQEAADRERMMSQVVLGEEAVLADASHRADALKRLRQLWMNLSAKANGPADNAERREARRVLSGLSMSVSEPGSGISSRLLASTEWHGREGSRSFRVDASDEHARHSPRASPANTFAFSSVFSWVAASAADMPCFFSARARVRRSAIKLRSAATSDPSPDAL